MANQLEGYQTTRGFPCPLRSSGRSIIPLCVVWGIGSATQRGNSGRCGLILLRGACSSAQRAARQHEASAPTPVRLGRSSLPALGALHGIRECVHAGSGCRHEPPPVQFNQSTGTEVEKELEITAPSSPLRSIKIPASHFMCSQAFLAPSHADRHHKTMAAAQVGDQDVT